MSILQPLLHDLTCTYAAPVQAWSDADGLMGASGIIGIYHADTRLVREVNLDLQVDDAQAISREVISHNHTRYVWTLRNYGMEIDPEVTLTIDRKIFNPVNSAARVTESYTVRNASSSPFKAPVRIRVFPDATPMDQIKAGRLDQSAFVMDGSHWHSNEQHARLSSADFAIATGPEAITLSTDLVVAPGDAETVSWSVELSEESAVVTAPSRLLNTQHVVTQNNPANELLLRSMSDIDGLLLSHTAYPELRFAAAGAPWFFTLFGRDSIITARFLLDIDPSLAADTVRLLAKFQGTKVNPQTAEQPGKILHEVRRAGISPDPKAGLPSLPPIYYGTIDATPMWISLLKGVHDAGVLGNEIYELLPNLRAALSWMRDYGDADGDGFLEYLDETNTGLANQGWKDSGDSVRWMDGSLADGPIALCEVQGYAYKAALDGATLLEELDPSATEEVATWRQWAANLKRAFRDQFWVKTTDGHHPAIALDAQKRPVDSLSSNIGHLLGTGILEPDEAKNITELLVAPSMFSGLGIRTVSTSNGGYWPLRYHVGTVWPHDTAICIEGMLTEGFNDEARTIALGLLDAAERFDYRLPELFGGAEVTSGAQPLRYPASCRPQAWAAASAAIIAKALAD